MKKLGLSIVCAGIAAFLLVSCERERTGVIDLSLTPPRIVASNHAVDLLNLDRTAVGNFFEKLPDGSYRISDSVSIVVTDPDGPSDIRRAYYRLYRPEMAEASAAGPLTPDGSSDSDVVFRGRITFSLWRSETGIYGIELIAQDQSGLRSNLTRLSIRIVRDNLPPILIAASTPDTVRRPASGPRPVFFAASAADPDGQGDISKVFFRSINSSAPNFEFELFDDGDIRNSGDSTAHDGRFSRIIPIDSTATLGLKEFRFWARDKAGMLSDSISRFIAVIAE